MQEKTLLNQTNSTSNILSSDFGSVSYDIFGSPYQKSGSFLANDSLDFGYLGNHNTIAIITSDLKNLDIGDNLELVIFENC